MGAPKCKLPHEIKTCGKTSRSSVQVTPVSTVAERTGHSISSTLGKTALTSSSNARTREIIPMAKLPDIGLQDITIVHVSDLHLRPRDFTNVSVAPADPGAGAPKTEWRLQNKHWLRLWSDAACEDVAVCVASGDFAFSSPDEEVYARLSDELSFRAKHRIVVPGNHDRRSFGNFFYNGSAFETAFENWQEPWWDETAALLIVPIDSNPGHGEARIPWAAPLARGMVPQAELLRLDDAWKSLETKIREALKKRVDGIDSSELGDVVWYLQTAFPMDVLESVWNAGSQERARKILVNVLTARFMARAVRCVVLHHHPMGIADTEGLGLTHQDAYLALTNAGDFLQRCLQHDVSLVLHGHKHFPFRMVVGIPGVDIERLGVVGAGSTTLRGSIAAPSANVLRVTATGEVSVKRIDLIGNHKQQPPKDLVVRSWSQVKAHLKQVAEQQSKWTVDRVTVDVQVFSTGDALMLLDFVGLAAKSGLQPSGVVEQDAGGQFFVRYPIQLRGIGGGLPTCACTTVDWSQRNQIGGATLHVTFFPESASWRGFVRINVTTPAVPNLRLTLRFLMFAAMATNPWQAWCLFGDQDRDERFLVRASVPTSRAFLLDIRHDEAPFEHVQQIYDDPSGIISQSELESIQLDVGPRRDHLRMSVASPLWGARYGVGWQLQSDQTAPRFAIQAWNPAVLSQFEKELRERAAAHRVELTLFAIAKSANSRCHLQSIIRVPPRDGRPPRTWPIGVGVAGRAAWLQTAILWAKHVSEEADVDFYLPEPNEPVHEAVVAIPIHGANGYAIGVLSFATRHATELAQAVREALKDDSEPPPSSLEWCWQLATQIETKMR